MYYPTAQSWYDAPQKRVLLFAMSGLGKTHVASMMREAGNWFHYSVDYRIGTRYMGELIVDNFKKEAMQNPFLRELLMSDSLYIASNITFDNLAPLSTYLGKPGNPARGGLDIDEYRKRQAQHHAAEVSALLDTTRFIDRARDLYGYDHFICDTSGSICEVVDPHDPKDPVLTELSENLQMVWIKGTDAHTAELIKRFDRAPKPMCYQTGFLDQAWDDYLAEKSQTPDSVDPDDFVRWTYARALAHRQPIYQAMADNWGVTIEASEMALVKTPDDLTRIVGRALERREANA